MFPSAIACGIIAYVAVAAGSSIPPPPPAPEPISIVELPLPPMAPSNKTNACTMAVNASGTGCLANGVFNTFQSGDFLPNGMHVLAQVMCEGAPAAPNPASIYSGMQVIIVKADGTKFSNGDSWKCITCGVPDRNAIGIGNSQYNYPQAFRDGSRLLVGHNVLDCSAHQVTSDDYTPEKTFLPPLRWNIASDDSGATGAIRELRLHPENVLHISASTILLPLVPRNPSI